MFSTAPRFLSLSSLLLKEAAAAPSTTEKVVKTVKKAAVAVADAVKPKSKTALHHEGVAARKAERELSQRLTVPFARPLSGYLKFLGEKDLHRKKGDTRTFKETSQEAAEKWRALSDEEKKAYSPTESDVAAYASKVEQWYAALSPEDQKTAYAIKGIPKSFGKDGRKEARAAGLANGTIKPNAWLDFLMNYRKENDITGKSVTQVVQEAKLVYAEQKKQK